MYTRTGTSEGLPQMFAHQSGQKAMQCGSFCMCTYGHPPPSLLPGREAAAVVWSPLEVALLGPLHSAPSPAVRPEGSADTLMCTHVRVPYRAEAPLTRARPWVSYHPMDTIKALGTWPLLANQDRSKQNLMMEGDREAA